MFRGRRWPIAVSIVASLIAVVTSSAAGLRETASRQGPPWRFDVGPDSAADATILCHDIRTGTDISYFARALTLNGELDPAATPLALCLSSVEGLQLRAVRDSVTGEITVVWTDSRRGEPDIFAKRFTASGDTVAGWPVDGVEVCAAPHSQSQVDACDDGAGGIFVAWADYRSGIDADIYVQHLLANGSPALGWPVGGVAWCSARGEQGLPHLAGDGQGGVYAFWIDRRSGQLELYGQRGGAAGADARAWAEDGAAVASSEGQVVALSLMPTDNGQVMAIWRSEVSGSSELRGLKLEPAGTAAPGWNEAGAVIATSGVASDPITIADGSGGVLVAWVDAERRLRAQRLTSSATLAWDGGGATLSPGPVAIQAPAVQEDGSGGALLAWQDMGDSTGSKIRALRISGSGAAANGWTTGGIDVTEAPGEYFRPSISAPSADSVARVTVTWSAEGSSPEAILLRLRSAAAQGPRLLEAKALPQVVRLTWAWAGSQSVPYHIYRRSDGEDWRLLGELHVHEQQLRFEDREVSEGSLDYCLSLLQGGNEYFFQPIPVIVPAAPKELALSRARYAVSQRSILATVALPTAQPAQLTLFDVSGRRVAHLDVGALGVGEHDIALPVHRAASSIYFLRLTQGPTARTTKLALIR